MYCKSLTSLALGILSIFGIIVSQKNYSNSVSNIKENIDYYWIEEQLEAEANFIKQTPSFGFSNLIADWTFLKYIQYFGDNEVRDEVGYSVITDYFEAIIDKDPRFIKAHLSISATNSIFAGRPEKTVSLLEQSAKSLTPDMQDYPFMVFAYKAVDEILFLGDLEAAQESYRKAAEWAELKNDEEGNHVAKIYRNTIKFLATNPDSSFTQVSGWAMVLGRNNDPRIQQHAIQKIRELGGEVNISPNGRFEIKPPKFNSAQNS